MLRSTNHPQVKHIQKRLLQGMATGLLLMTASVSYAKSYVHDLGSVNIDEVPQRVVVLGYGSLDFVDALGVTPVGMPKQLLPATLEKYKDAQFINTGSLKEVNYETLFTLKPDLIIAEGRMARIYKDLNEIAPTYMFQIDTKDYWNTTKKHWENLSEIFGKQQKGAELIANIDNKINQLHQQAEDKPLKTLTVMSNGSNITKFGAVSRFSFIYQEAGFKTSTSENVKTKAATHGNLISFEYIADAKPDVLLILDRDQAIGTANGHAEELFDNSLVNSTPAAKNNEIKYLDPSAWYLASGGYQSTKVMIDDLNHVFNHAH
ncbi:siderophore ABC transporter substrate-binding protein [Vibrio sp. SS-MA-C1-2]|uniref:siderophore ABC transporter substrate-binding protein n=1 Tax=Vibrio sp. SS-MA-C1-2 TaxID=2908646 RepID=UPI001F2A2E33|nr:siderophore ABC transporter substrate-binding protein [Vibrio sp. SS-MA-C1-2]UJF18387.1 siderophore ABC transporter substrate-binding protein [Vibrio sp. SS-MA-C1-2]